MSAINVGKAPEHSISFKIYGHVASLHSIHKHVVSIISVVIVNNNNNNNNNNRWKMYKMSLFQQYILRYTCI